MKHVGNIRYAEGSKHKTKRIARGQGSGHGGTATRGHNGQRSRAGAKIKPAFEGGQMPMNRRLPKFGFFNRFRVDYQTVNLIDLQDLVDRKLISDNVDFDVLLKLRRINHRSKPLKILANGELNVALKVKAHKISKSAINKIEAAGGVVSFYE